jgi:hypothetical protein
MMSSREIDIAGPVGRLGIWQPAGDHQTDELQIKMVASPGFGPIFRLFVRNGLVFGIGGFEPPI